MIEFFEVMFRALTGLKLTGGNLIGIFAFFVAGYYLASTTKRLNPLKTLLILGAGYFISQLLSALLGVYTLAFLIGFLSNLGSFVFRVLLWAGNLKELFFLLQHRTIAEDIHETEEAAQQTEEPKREKPAFKQAKPSQDHGQSQSNWKPGKQFNKADYEKCMKILELSAITEKKEIRKAYRRMAMRYHPDRPETGDAQKFIQGGIAYEYLDRFWGEYTQASAQSGKG